MNAQRLFGQTLKVTAILVSLGWASAHAGDNESTEPVTANGPAVYTEQTKQDPEAIQDESALNKIGFDSSIPTGVAYTIRKRDQSKNKPGAEFLPDAGHRFSIGVDGGMTQQFMDQGKDQARASLAVNVGYEIGPLAAALRLNASDLVSKAIDNDYDGTFTNGVTTVNVQDVIERGVVTLTPFRYVNAEGKEVVAIAFTVGRDAATPLGTYVMEGWQAISILEDRQLTQLDQIKVSARFYENTIIEVVNFGYDWLGYSVDPLQDITEEGGDSFAINVKHKFDKIFGDKTSLEIYFSYADVAEGITYTRALAGNQPGANNTYGGGARLNWDKFTIAAEGYVEQPDNSSLDDRYGLAVITSYQLGKLTPKAGIEMVDEGSGTDMIYSLGVDWAIFSNLVAQVMWQHVDPNTGETQENFLLGFKVGADLAPVLAKDTRSEKN